jgi:hypothetical protein
MSYVIDNNVQCTLNTGINTVVTSIIVNAAVAPNRNPVAPSGGNTGVITLMDSLVSPTKIEVITYSTSTNNGDGTFTLSGCTRGQEGFAAQSFIAGAACIGAVTAAVLAALVPTGNSTLLQFCGDGSDGDLIVSTGITLTADKYYRNLTMIAGGSINTGGYAVYVSGVLDLTAAIAGAITAPSGVAGTNTGAAGSGGVGITCSGGTNGGSGGTLGAAGAAGIQLTAAHGGPGGAGGSGTGAGGIGADYSVAKLHDVRRPAAPFLLGATQINGGMGGGGGGGGTAGPGGGGGGGGSTLVVYAGTITTSPSTPTGVLSAGTGGVGGAASGANGGGGGGGGGGAAIVGYGLRIGQIAPFGIQSIGGARGSNGAGGSGGLGGGSGALHVYNLLTGVSAASAAIASGGAGGRTTYVGL